MLNVRAIDQLGDSFASIIAEEEYLLTPNEEPYQSFNDDILPRNYHMLPNSEVLLKMLKDSKSFKYIKDKYVRIGVNDYLIKKNIGEGAEGLIYLAETLDHHEVIIKAILDFKKARRSYYNELHGLRKLSRLYDHDDEHLVLVEEKMNGQFFDEFYDDYVKNHGASSDYPSNIIPPSMNQKFFQILYNFRNQTNMAHNDFRPYNIIGDTVIDFGRSEELSSDPVIRQKQIDDDDKTAKEEWSYFVARRDVYGIEKNPFLPNSREVAIKSWKFYTDRYPGDSTRRYQKDWMETLDYILTNNDTNVDFLDKGQY